MYFVLRDARTGRTFGELDDTQQTLSPNRFSTRDTDPPAYRFVAPADGWYLLLVSSRDADVLADVRQVYRVRLTPELPDFRLVAVGPSNTNAETCTLPQGGSRVFRRVRLAARRLDGADHPHRRGTAARDAARRRPSARVRRSRPGPPRREDATDWTGPLRIHGPGQINGQHVEREALAASIPGRSAAAGSAPPGSAGSIANCCWPCAARRLSACRPRSTRPRSFKATRQRSRSN